MLSSLSMACDRGMGALGPLPSPAIRRLENFAGVMNFVIFPMFFVSTALYPPAQLKQAGPLPCCVCAINPFTHAIELIRFALYARLEPLSAVAPIAAPAVLLAPAACGCDPAEGLMARRAAE